MKQDLTSEGRGGLASLGTTRLPRLDSAIVVVVTAAIVALIVLWMTSAAGARRSSQHVDYLDDSLAAEARGTSPTFSVSGD